MKKRKTNKCSANYLKNLCKFSNNKKSCKKKLKKKFSCK